MGNDSSTNAAVTFGAVPSPAPRAQEASADARDGNNGAEYGAVMAAFGALGVHSAIDPVGHPQNERILSAGADDARYLSDAGAVALQGAPLTPAVGWAPTGLPPDWSSPQSRAGSGSAPSREGVGRSSLGAQQRAKQHRGSASLDPAASLPDDVFDETSPLAAPPVLDAGSLLLPPTFYYHQHAFGPSSSGLTHVPVAFGQGMNLGPNVTQGIETQLGARTTRGQLTNAPNNEQSGAARPAQQAGRGYAARGGRGRGGRGGGNSRGRGGFGQASRQSNVAGSTAAGAAGQAPGSAEKGAGGGPKKEGAGRGGGPSRWRGGRQKNGNKSSNNNNAVTEGSAPPLSAPASAF